jgi:heme exporter protein B
MTGAPAAMAAVLRRDLRLALRNRGEALHPLIFFVVTTSLFPLALSPGPETLRTVAPGVLWVGALLAALLSLDSLFRGDLDDGTLEQLALAPHPLSLLVLAKVTAHWLATGLPLLLAAPLLATFLALPAHALPVLLASLLLGTPTLSLVGAIGVGLTVGLRRGGALLALLVLPMYVPVLVFGASAVAAAIVGLPATGQLYMLAAFLALALVLAPPAAAAALRVSLD